MKDTIMKSSQKIVNTVRNLYKFIQTNARKSKKSIDILEQELAEAEENETDVISNREHRSFWLI